MIPRAKQFLSALAGFIIVILVAGPQAQQPPQFAATSTPASTAAAREPVDAPTDIDLLVGRSTVLNIGSTIARVSLTVPDIADAMVTAPSQLLIHGKQPGTISLFVWDRGGAIKTYEVRVRRDLSALVAQLKQLFPGEPISVNGSGKDVIVSGTVTSKYVIEKAAEVAGGYVEKKENVVNLLKQQEGVASNQVMLRVRFAEVSRNALQELGAALVANGFKSNWFGRTTTQQFAAPDFKSDGDGTKLVFSDFLNLFVFNAKEGLGAVVKALQNAGVFQSLAEPNLVALNGKEASFLAGGEFPYPVPQGGANNSVTIQFKEFGVRLSFTPTVLGGDLINLKIKPEVSTLDFNNAISINGFRLPAIATRRADTEVELRDGQTFAIAGLMNNTALSSVHKIPGLGDIPVLGALFKSRAYQKEQTELVVMVTPVILRRDSTGASTGLPSLVEPFMDGNKKPLATPDPYVGSPRYPVTQPAPRSASPKDVPEPPTSTSATSQIAEPQPATRTQKSAPSTQTRTKAPASKPAQPKSPAAPAKVSAVPSQSVTSGVPEAIQEPVAVSATSAAETPAAAVTAPLTAAQKKAIATARTQEKKDARAAAVKQALEVQAATLQRAVEEKRQAEEAKVLLKKSEDDRRAAEKIARERAVREAEVAKKNAEAARLKADEDQKHEKSLADAAARLKEAQAAYQSEIDKTKGDSSEKAKSSGKTIAPPDPRH